MKEYRDVCLTIMFTALLLAGATAAEPDATKPCPPLEQCLRRINIVNGDTDASAVTVQSLMKQSGVMDCDCNFWVFMTQVHGYCCHPTSVGAVKEGLVKTDPVDNLVRTIRQGHPGSRVIAYMHPRTTYALSRHPEWQSINAFNATPIEASGPVGCLNTGFLDGQLKPYLKELLEKYDFDGFWFDGTLLNRDECGCAVCRKAFQADTGLAFPELADRNLHKPNYRRWMQWRLETHEKRLSELLPYVQGLKSSCSIQVLQGYGREWVAGSTQPMSLQSMFRLPTETCLEYFWHVDEPGDPLYTGFAARLSRGLAGRLTEGWYPPACHGTDGVGVPREELMTRVWTLLAQGVVPQIPMGGWSRIEDLQQVYREIRAREEYLTGINSLKHVGLVAGETSDLAMSNAAVRAGLVPEVLGFYRMLVEEHLPVDVLGNINLERDELSGYRVLVLPEYCVLTDRAAGKIREYVNGGGGLVCSGRTGLFSADGAALPNFALADLFGADFLSFQEEKDLTRRWMSLTIPEDYFPKDAVLHRSSTTSLLGMGSGRGKGGASYWGNVVSAQATSAKEILTLRVRDEKEKSLPFLLRNTVGRGRVSYLAARMGQAYDKYSYPYLRRIVANEIEWAGAGLPPVCVEAPLCVQATYWTQAQGGGKTRLVIQLLNETTGQGRPRLNRGSWPIREEVTRIAGVRLRLADRFSNLTPVTRPEGVPLEKGSDGAHVLPALGLYQIITADEK